MKDLPNPETQLKRSYLPDNFQVTDWESLRKFYDELLNRPIHSVDDLEAWVLDENELEAVTSEDRRWRYIRISCNSNDKKAEEAFNYFVKEITPNIAQYNQQLNQKLVSSPFVKSLDKNKFRIYLRDIENAIRLYREENIPIHTEIQMYSKEFATIASEMTIILDGNELTLQQASVLLTETNRELRESVYRKTSERRLEDAGKLDDLFDKLIEKRQLLAQNAGFDNFRDFKFADLGRFDYGPEDCYAFHDAIANEVVPLVDEMNRQRQKYLGIDRIRPWDLSVDPLYDEPLMPYKNVNELIEKSILCLSDLHPYFGNCISIMDQMNHLDLDSRKGKRPGGYNMPLPETGIPFIFMNSANSMRDMRTMMHEAGHAVHSLLTREKKMNIDKRPPSEVAELAAMAMELLTMDFWPRFFDSEEDYKRARIWQLQKSVSLLPWVATISKFQHWLYTNEGHTSEERDNAWLEIFHEFESDTVNWTGLEPFSRKLWQRQLHLFEVPFYYIEYGMAQLGAIAIWRNYRRDPEKTLQNYIEALELGYTKPIGEIYEKAGIQFNFSSAYVSELMDFVSQELKELTS
ncbi:MAG: M3 family oligoendopeptidase [Bacteroidota bacterium]